MLVIRSVRQMVSTAERLRHAGKRIGFVPTMGALHEGHLSLIRAAHAQTDVVVVSIFVNSLQFGPREDFARYPRRLTRDVRCAAAAGAEIVFAPTAAQIYPPGFQTHVVPGPLADRWEGRTRPGHFRGVATVMALLFELTQPTDAYFGQKDYQQALIIERLIRDLHLPIRMHLLPTVREPDGLALSSRNASLSPAQRAQATVLCAALRRVRARIRNGERRAALLLAEARALISAQPLARLDYVAIADAETLQPIRRLRGRLVVLVAAWVGRTRLIDNILVDVS